MLDMVGAALAAQGAESISQEQRRLRLLCEVRVPRLTLHRPQPQPQPTPRLHLHPSPLSPPPAQAVCALSAADKGTVVQAPPYSQLATCFGAVLLPACYLPATCLLLGRSCSPPWRPTSEGPYSPSCSARCSQMSAPRSSRPLAITRALKWFQSSAFILASKQQTGLAGPTGCGLRMKVQYVTARPGDIESTSTEERLGPSMVIV
jgi:hypothetical protein